MIYSHYGSKVEIIGPILKDGTIWIKRVADSVEFNLPVSWLRADGGTKEIEKQANLFQPKPPKPTGMLHLPMPGGYIARHGKARQSLCGKVVPTERIVYQKDQATCWQCKQAAEKK